MILLKKKLLGRLLSHVIAVGLLSYVCTEMDYMLIMLAVRMLHSQLVLRV